ncbi:Por secretion system C-terminal sorting domain-containing protein [Candidatus Kryptobacter tengchongensis]|nr:Por secretion system C-terminal sorting domain-containing protein [Candidatus Kryptobacter tengchongensis]
MMRKIFLNIFLLSFLFYSTIYSQQGLIFKLFDNPDVPNGPVYAILPYGDTVFVGGAFHFWGPPIGSFGALDLKTGDVDTNFFRLLNGQINTIIPDGKGGFYLGGYYTLKVMGKNGLIKSFSGIIHVNSDGSIDDNFKLSPNLRLREEIIVNKMILLDSILYVAGKFRIIGDSIRTHIAALDARTGKVLPWKTDSIIVQYLGIKALAISDSVLFIGGDIQKIGNSTRYGIAALNIKTGELLPWNPMVKFGSSAGKVYAIAVNDGDVYIGGQFDSVGTYKRLSLALINKITGEIKGWNPAATYSQGDNYPAIVNVIKTYNSNLYVGGSFNYINVEKRNKIACFDLSTGQLTSWKANLSFTHQNVITGSEVYDLAFVGDTIFIAGNTLTGIVTSTDTIFRYGIIALNVNGNVVDWKGSVVDNDDDNPPGLQSMIGALVFSIQPWNGKLLVAANPSTRIMGSLGRQVKQRNSLCAVNAKTGKIINDWIGPEFNFVEQPYSINQQGNYINQPVKLISALAIMDSTLYVGGNMALTGGRWYDYLNVRGYPDIFVALDLKTGQVKKKWNFGTANNTLNYWAGYNGVKKIIPTPRAIYVAGGFGYYLPETRGLVIIEPRTGSILNWSAKLFGGVNSIDIKNDTLFVAGWFTKVLDTIPRTFMAAFSTRLDSVKLLDWQTDPFHVGYDQYNRITTAPIDIAIDDSVIYICGGFTITGDSTRERIASIYTYNGKVTKWKPEIQSGSYYYSSVALTDSVAYFAGSSVEALSKKTGKKVSREWQLRGHPTSTSKVVEVNQKYRHVYIGGKFIDIFDGNNSYPIPFFIVRPYAEDIATAIEKTPHIIPNNYQLYQNYPNPFNPATKIEFEIPQKEHVKLTIYDILGREVMKVFEDEISAGRYSISVDMSGYPSGVYFYRLEAGKFVSVKKMMLIK